MQHVLVFRCEKARQFRAVVLLLLLGSFPAFGQQDDLDRDYEPVIITGNQLTDFITTSTSQLFLYKYTAATGSWEQIPFQFDDVDGSGTYFGEADGLLDANDELAFMAKDMGDRAPNYSWIDDANSRNYHRYEITVTDGTDADKKAWAYLYRSNTLTYTPTTDYI